MLKLLHSILEVELARYKQVSGNSTFQDAFAADTEADKIADSVPFPGSKYIRTDPGYNAAWYTAFTTFFETKDLTLTKKAATIYGCMADYLDWSKP